MTAHCNNLCDDYDSKGGKNFVDKFWCSHCDRFIPADQIIIGYGYRCKCCKCRLRKHARKKSIQADLQYERYPKRIEL